MLFSICRLFLNTITINVLGLNIYRNIRYYICLVSYSQMIPKYSPNKNFVFQVQCQEKSTTFYRIRCCFTPDEWNACWFYIFAILFQRMMIFQSIQ